MLEQRIISDATWPQEHAMTPKSIDIQVKNAYKHGSEALGSLTHLLKVDLAESPHSFHIEAELPGVRKECIDIFVKGGFLVVRAERKRIHDQDTWKSHHRELEFGKVERSFRIPPNAEVHHTKALFENGILSISIPKTTASMHPSDEQHNSVVSIGH